MPRRVKGTVQREGGLPQRGLRVYAYHIGDRSAIQFPSSATTDARGRYQIRYEAPDGVDQVNLQISVYSADNQILGGSNVIRNAGEDETIDVTLPAETPVEDRVVRGRVSNDAGVPQRELLIYAYHIGDGAAIQFPASDTTDAEGRYEIRYQLPSGVDKINLQIAVYSADNNRLKSSDIIPNAGEDETVDVILPAELPGTATFRVSGRVVSRVSAAVGDLRVVIVDKGIGGDATLAETRTGPGGAYGAVFKADKLRERGKAAADLQVQVFGPEGWLVSSPVRYDAGADVVIDVALGDSLAGALASEHDTLIADLARFTKEDLGKLKEDASRQDITWLANKTGWDARAVAIAALSERLGKATGIQAPYCYALLRAGLPAEPDALFRTSPALVRNVLEAAVKGGVLPGKLSLGIDKAVEGFERQAATAVLDGKGGVGLSNLRELLAGNLDGAAEQERFADLVVAHSGEPEVLWKEAESKFGPEVTSRLQNAGRLAFLTINNAGLIGALQAAVGDALSNDPSAMVQAGFHAAKAWEAIIGDKVPEGIKGPNLDERRQNYARILAAQVRLAFPTAVVGELVGSGDLPVTNAAMRKPVQDFLRAHSGKFEIGAEPAARYVAKNNITAAPGVVSEITRLQRLYQITPDETAMAVLLRAGIGSATEVVRLQEADFVATFGKKLGGDETARRIHAQARQVHGAVLNIAIGYLSQRGAPGIGVHSPPSFVDPVPVPPANAADVIAYATLESAFGEMDFCACEHCRSVLSPAAYMVDLLMFLDAPASKVPAGKVNPQTVLLDRRPDIQHLALTCENTNTPMPYIDLVNETLEYFVVQGLSLAGFSGYDTDPELAPEDLLADPQNVRTAAYDTLAQSAFPPPLPFHRPLERNRRLLAKFDTPLPGLMADLRVSDALERGAQTYGLRDIRLEALGLSRPEHRLLTLSWPDAGPPDPLETAARLHGLNPAAGEAALRAELQSARTYARRAGLSYEELAQLLRNWFVNPHAVLIPKLERLGVSFADIKALADGTVASLTYAPGVDPADYGGNIDAWLKDPTRYAQIMGLLTLANPGNPGEMCDFSKVELRYSNPDPLASAPKLSVFVRLARFVRLWKKLGWSIAETDAAISALWDVDLDAPSTDSALVAALDEGFLRATARLGVAQAAFDALGLVRKRDLQPLLALFAPINTHGKGSLYDRMFPPGPVTDPAFLRNADGGVLTDGTAHVFDHLDALRAAFGLRAGEVKAIATALGFDSNTPLSLANISAVYRHGWLARRLKMSVDELIALSGYLGLAPFGLPDAASPALLTLIARVEALREAGLKPGAALTHVWNHHFGLVPGGIESDITALARDLRKALAGVEAEFALDSEPDAAVARSVMGLAYPSETVDLFFGAIDLTTRVSTSYDHDAETLSAAVLAAGDGRVDYDDFAKEISFAGVMTVALRDALKLVPAQPAGFDAAVDNLFAASGALFGPMFTRHPELQARHDAYLASADPVPKRLGALIAALSPDLIARRNPQLVVPIMASAGGIDPTLVGRLLTVPAALHADGNAARPALDDLTAMDVPGLSAAFYFAANTGGAVDQTADAVLPDYAAGTARTLPKPPANPAAKISAVLTGFLEAEVEALHQIRVEADSGASVKLVLGGSELAMADDGGGVFTNAAPVILKAGAPVAIELTVENTANRLRLVWRTPTAGWQTVPGADLYSKVGVERMRTAHLRLLRAGALASVLGLASADMAHCATDPALQIGGEGWLNRLPTRGAPSAGDARALGDALEALLAYARLQHGLAFGKDQLAGLMVAARSASLAAPVTTTAADLAALFQWNVADVAALLGHFGLSTRDLAKIPQLDRVARAMRRVKRLGITAAELIAATGNEPDETVASALTAALRSSFAPADWHETIRPINDAMRALQRDALAAYILHNFSKSAATSHIDTVNKLFEYFLMDVAMEPCMLTSRVRNALSSIQLFTERCLLDLEPRVSPSSLDAEQWSWMKRYRVWEANRKVFLFPENWLEPELRDDQSPIFRETMSELLQGDITEDRAAEALVGYLRKLDEVAKLEISGMFHEVQEGGRPDIPHVIGRTAGARHSYFYRKREALHWTPWQKIRLDIDDDPVMPVVWRDRLFLFWLKIVVEPRPKSTPSVGSKTMADTPANAIFSTSTQYVDVKAILNWSERVNGEWQPARTSDPNRPLYIDKFAATGSGAFARPKLRLSAGFWGAADMGLRVAVGYEAWGGSTFYLYNPFSDPEPHDGPSAPHSLPFRVLDTAGSGFSVAYQWTGRTDNLFTGEISDDAGVGPNHHVDGASTRAPFFYQDRRYAFFVSTRNEWRSWHTRPGYGGLMDGLVRMRDPAIKLLTQPDRFAGVSLVDQKSTPGFGVVDPSPLERWVTEDAYIDKALGTGGTILFDGSPIGPSGSTVGVKTRI